MAEEETTSSKFFWWVMGIVSTVVSAEIIALLGLSGVHAASATRPGYAGTYVGAALNHGAIGNVRLQVDQVDPASGATTAQVNWSGALSGAGPLRGTFDANLATFSGEIDSQEGPWNVQLNCTFSGGTKVTCSYQLQPLAPNSYGFQQGSLTANK